MGVFKSLEEAREFFKNDKYGAMSGVCIEELSEESVLCSMELTELHKNAYGGIMGGAIFTLADVCFAVSCNNRHQPTVALNVNINYMNASKGSKLFARSRCLKDGRTTGLYEILVTDDQGKDIAIFTANGFKL